MSTHTRHFTRGQPAESSSPGALLGLVGLLTLSGAGLLALVGPPDLGKLPAMPSGSALEVLARSQNVPLDGVLQVASLLTWLVWAWAAASLVVELALAVLEHGPARGAAWVRGARAVADRVSLPLARRAVATALVVQVVARAAAPAAAASLESSTALVVEAREVDASVSRSPMVQAARSADIEEAAPSADVVRHTVQRGETLWSIARRYYGSGEEYERVIEANHGKVMRDGRVFDRAALIYPGWVLEIPLPSTALERQPDGSLAYVVRKGDTLRGISARVLGDEQRYVEIFDLNVGMARVNGTGPVLRDPNLIWPNLRLRVPVEPPRAGRGSEPESVGVAGEPEPAAEPEAAPPAPIQESVSPPPSPQVPVMPESAASAPMPVAPVMPVVEATLRAPVEPVPVPAAEPAFTRPAGAQQGAGAPPASILAGAAATAAALAGVGALVVRRRRHTAPASNEAESAVVLSDGFAEADPAQQFAQRLAGQGIDPAAQVAARLSRAYAAVLSTTLSRPEQAEVFGQVSLVSIRQGRSSTSLMLSAPVAARAHLVRYLPDAAMRAFGDDVDVEGLVSQESDVLVRLMGVRQALRGRLLDLAGDSATELEGEIWPAPTLVPLGLLADRQKLLANWNALSHVLIAAPLGQGAEAVLVALLASLAGERPPSDLGLVTIAAPRTLPQEVLAMPHQLVPIVDPQQLDAVRATIEQVRAEVERRAVAGPNGEPDVVLVVGELADVPSEALSSLGAILVDGPRNRVRLLAATVRPADELARACPLVGELATRLVLHAADEDESVALLGMPGAEELDAGGQLLLRLEGRMPVQATGYRVTPHRLARLVKLMDQRRPMGSAGAPSPVPGDKPVPTEVPGNCQAEETAGADAPLEPSTPADFAGGAAGATLHDEQLSSNGHDDLDLVPGASAHPDRAHATGQLVGHAEGAGNGFHPVAEIRGEQGNRNGFRTDADVPVETVERGPSPTSNPGATERCLASPLLRQLNAAPLRIRCLGTRQVWYQDQLVWPNPAAVEETGWELLLVVAAYEVTGVQSETLADLLWPGKVRTERAVNAILRKRRWRLRKELKRLLPELDADPLPTSDDQVQRLDPAVVASDVHWFLELATCAKGLSRESAIAAYEEALELYRGDLLDGADVPSYWWLYEGPKLGIGLRQRYRSVQDNIRLHLAELRASGTGEADLLRAQELYAGLTAEQPEEARLWAALFKVCGRLGDQLSLEVSVRRLRSALVELRVGKDPDTVPLPPSLERVLDEVRVMLEGGARPAAPEKVER